MAGTKTRDPLDAVFEIAGVPREDWQEPDWAGPNAIAACVRKGIKLDPDVKTRFIEAFTPILEAAIEDDELLDPRVPDDFEQFKRNC